MTSSIPTPLLPHFSLNSTFQRDISTHISDACIHPNMTYYVIRGTVINKIPQFKFKRCVSVIQSVTANFDNESKDLVE